MTVNQSEQTQQSVSKAVTPFSERLKVWIEDPMASAILASVTTLAAVTVVLTGMAVINVAIN